MAQGSPTDQPEMEVDLRRQLNDVFGKFDDFAGIIGGTKQREKQLFGVVPTSGVMRGLTPYVNRLPPSSSLPSASLCLQEMKNVPPLIPPLQVNRNEIENSECASEASSSNSNLNDDENDNRPKKRKRDNNEESDTNTKRRGKKEDIKMMRDLFDDDNDDEKEDWKERGNNIPRQGIKRMIDSMQVEPLLAPIDADRILKKKEEEEEREERERRRKKEREESEKRRKDKNEDEERKRRKDEDEDRKRKKEDDDDRRKDERRKRKEDDERKRKREDEEREKEKKRKEVDEKMKKRKEDEEREEEERRIRKEKKRMEKEEKRLKEEEERKIKEEEREKRRREEEEEERIKKRIEKEEEIKREKENRDREELAKKIEEEKKREAERIRNEEEEREKKKEAERIKKEEEMRKREGEERRKKEDEERKKKDEEDKMKREKKREEEKRKQKEEDKEKRRKEDHERNRKDKDKKGSLPLDALSNSKLEALKEKEKERRKREKAALNESKDEKNASLSIWSEKKKKEWKEEKLKEKKMKDPERTIKKEGSSARSSPISSKNSSRVATPIPPLSLPSTSTHNHVGGASPSSSIRLAFPHCPSSSCMASALAPKSIPLLEERADIEGYTSYAKEKKHRGDATNDRVLRFCHYMESCIYFSLSVSSYHPDRSTDRDLNNAGCVLKDTVDLIKHALFLFEKDQIGGHMTSRTKLLCYRTQAILNYHMYYFRTNKFPRRADALASLESQVQEIPRASPKKEENGGKKIGDKGDDHVTPSSSSSSLASNSSNMVTMPMSLWKMKSSQVVTYNHLEASHILWNDSFRGVTSNERHYWNTIDNLIIRKFDWGCPLHIGSSLSHLSHFINIAVSWMREEYEAEKR